MVNIMESTTWLWHFVSDLALRALAYAFVAFVVYKATMLLQAYLLGPKSSSISSSSSSSSSGESATPAITASTEINNAASPSSSKKIERKASSSSSSSSSPRAKINNNNNSSGSHKGAHALDGDARARRLKAMMELGFGFLHALPDGHTGDFPIFVTPDSPKWQLDRDGSSCHTCKRVFSTFFRRHHCRICGWIFCKRCSNWIVVHQRSCQRCFTKWKHLEGSREPSSSSPDKKQQQRSSNTNNRSLSSNRQASRSLHQDDGAASELLSLNRSYQINLNLSDDAVPLMKFYKLSSLTIKAMQMVSYVTKLEVGQDGYFRVSTSAAFKTVNEAYRLDHNWHKVNTPQGDKLAKAGVIAPTAEDLSLHIYMCVVYDETHVIASTRKLIRLPSSSSSPSSATAQLAQLHLVVELSVYECDAKIVARLPLMRTGLSRSMSVDGDTGDRKETQSSNNKNPRDVGATTAAATSSTTASRAVAASKLKSAAKFRPVTKPIEALEKCLGSSRQQLLKLKRIFDVLE